MHKTIMVSYDKIFELVQSALDTDTSGNVNDLLLAMTCLRQAAEALQRAEHFREMYELKIAGLEAQKHV